MINHIVKKITKYLNFFLEFHSYINHDINYKLILILIFWESLLIIIKFHILFLLIVKQFNNINK